MNKNPEGSGLKLDTNSPSVLIVDPISPLRLSIREILTSSGFIIIGEAEDVHQAVAHIKRIKPDLVIMSTKLKDEDGLAVLKLLRTVYPDLKAILLTGDTSEALSLAGNGETHVVTKPINRLRLVELANELTSKDKTSRERSNK